MLPPPVTIFNPSEKRAVISPAHRMALLPPSCSRTVLASCRTILRPGVLDKALLLELKREQTEAAAGGGAAGEGVAAVYGCRRALAGWLCLRASAPCCTKKSHESPSVLPFTFASFGYIWLFLDISGYLAILLTVSITSN